MKNPLIFLSICLLFFFTSCGDENADNSDCSSSSVAELSGTVLERPFGLQAARALYDEDEDEYQIQMFGDDDINITDVCETSGTLLIGSQITFFVDNTTETQDFGGLKIVTLFHAASMEFATTTSGCYSVDSITDTNVSGTLSLLNEDGSSMVSGTWSAKICD